MKKLIIPTLLFLTLVIFTLQSCTNKTQESTEIETEIAPEIVPELAPEIITENTISNEFESSIRPNEILELGKTYSDTVKYVEFSDEGDEWMFIVEKNENIIGLIDNNERETELVRGDELVINWKMDSIRYAGDDEFLDYTSFLISSEKIASLKLENKKVKFLWRENLYNAEFESDINTIIINEDYIKNISEPEKAALVYAATFIGNECAWDGNANEDRSNLKCKILSALNLGYQCSNQHLEFLRYWFRNNETILKELERCPTKPDGATVQNTFDEIRIEVNGNKITVFFEASGINMRESESWNWTEKHFYEFKENELVLIKKDISPKERHTFEMSEN